MTVYHCVRKRRAKEYRVGKGKTEAVTSEHYILCVLFSSLGFDPGTTLQLPTHGPLPTCTGSHPILTAPLSGESQGPSTLPRT